MLAKSRQPKKAVTIDEPAISVVSEVVAPQPTRKRAATKAQPAQPIQPTQPIDIPASNVECTPIRCRKRGPCSECGQKIRKPRAPTSTPSDKQAASREVFKSKVSEAKALQATTPGLSYKEAIKRVYGK